MNLKKIITLALSCAIMLQMLCFPASAEEKTINNEEISLLTSLGIIDSSFDAALIDGHLTRADFAVYVGNMLGVNETNKINKRYYIDLPEDHWAVNTINTLTQRGIISGSDGRFRPDDNISYAEAVSMLLIAAGYKKMAEDEGGYPKGYNIVASRNGIDTKISDYNAITLGEAIGILYDTLFLPAPQMKNMYGDRYTVELDKDVNLLESRFNVYLVKGYLTSVFGVSADAEQACGLNEVRIGGTVYDNSFHDAMDFLGIKVRAYYRNDNNDNDVFLICEDSTADYVKIDIRDFDGFDDDTYQFSYNPEGKTSVKKKIIEKNATIIKNGENVSYDIKGAFNNLNDGTIVLSSAGGSNHYDTVIIKNFENVVVSSFSKSEMKIYDKINRGNIVDIDGINYIRIKDRNGNEISAESIAQNMILSVCKSADFCEIITSEEIINGRIVQVRFDDPEGYILLDGTEYEISKSFYQENKSAFVSGRQIKLYVNAFGKGAWAEFYSGDEYTCGYVLRTFIDEESEKFGVKILTGSGNIEELLLTQKPKVNNKVCRSSGEVSVNLESRTGKSVNQVVVYKQNEDGEITAIETAVPNGQDAAGANLRVDKPLGSAYYYAGAGMMGESIIIGNNAVCFKVPEAVTSSTTDDDYSVINPSNLAEKQTYTVESYKTDEDTLSADILLVRSSTTSSNWFHHMVVVDKVYEVYNESKDETEIIADMWVNGNKVSYRAERNVSFDAMPQFFNSSVINKLTTGDVIRIFTNAEGEITCADLFYSAENNRPIQTINNYWSWEIYFAYGYITDIKNGVAKFEYNDNGEAITGLAKIEGAPVLIYDTAINKIIAGTTSDLDEAMNENSLVYFGQNFGTTQQIYIIK